MADKTDLLIRIGLQNDTQRGTSEIKAEMAALAETIKLAGTYTEEQSKRMFQLQNELRKAESAAKSFRSTMGSVGTTLSFFVTLPIVAFFSSATKAALDAEVQFRKTDAAFGSAAASIHAASQGSANRLGVSTLNYEKYAGNFGNIFTELGVGQSAAAGMSNALISRGRDVTARTGASMEEFLAAEQAALSGQTRALKRMQIVFSATDINKEAESEGTFTGKGMISDQAKALAVYNLTMQRSIQMAGSWNALKDTEAGRLQRVSAEYEDQKRKLGEGLMPALSSLLTIANGLIGAFDHLGPGGREFLLILAGVAAAVGPLMKVAQLVGAIGDGLSRMAAYAGARMAGGEGLLAGIGAGGVGAVLPWVAGAAAVGVLTYVALHPGNNDPYAGKVKDDLKNTDTKTLSGLKARDAMLRSKIAAAMSDSDAAKQAGYFTGADMSNKELQALQTELANTVRAEDALQQQVDATNAALGSTTDIQDRLAAFKQLNDELSNSQDVYQFAVGRFLDADSAKLNSAALLDQARKDINGSRYGATGLTGQRDILGLLQNAHAEAVAMAQAGKIGGDFASINKYTSDQFTGYAMKLNLDTSQIEHYLSLLQRNPIQIPVQFVSDGTVQGLPQNGYDKKLTYYGPNGASFDPERR